MRSPEARASRTFPSRTSTVGCSASCSRPDRRSCAGATRSWPSSPPTPFETRLAGRPASTTSTLRRARPSTRAALRPAGPPPTTRASRTAVRAGEGGTSHLVPVSNMVATSDRRGISHSSMSFDRAPVIGGDESTPPEERAMSTYLPYEANVSRVDDVVRAVRPRRAQTPVRPPAAEPVAIRRATAGDRESLDRLAALDSAGKVVGEALIAQVGDGPRAAIELVTG